MPVLLALLLLLFGALLVIVGGPQRRVIAVAILAASYSRRWRSSGSATGPPWSRCSPSCSASFKSAMDKLETPSTVKRGEEFQRFLAADAQRLAEGVR